MSCKIRVMKSGHLAFQLCWKGLPGGRSWEGTGLKATEKNRRRLEARAELINEAIEQGTFDYLEWFGDEGNAASYFKPEEPEAKPEEPTVRAYYETWITTKKAPLVRASLKRDYE